ncbi:hypothetical protein HYPSUDRAFT_135500 [Hypholoma sublateritium FD-334 SS-4]|uniref:Ribonucleases P/MRP subunit Pop8-like domain-containing protein n=1 Tax=Hypholoma sublateritium (strain FD-334 SS-4) TaxID=945553 RepID=A0A0D2P8E9_HYPSF|nr:hypothetical protein HYPSUDRAFT_135500 [Hypholoma sublateritium FD-334 SS-4]
MQTTFLKAENFYFRLKVAPPTKNDLAIRKTIADALSQSFGQTSAATFLDILWTSEDGKECVIRVQRGDATKVAAALASWKELPRLSVSNESAFLPSILPTNGGL